ncbi:MAG: LacI family DNA-binding transcriptional regulator [Candidatus Methylacidiphilales bacterium]
MKKVSMLDVARAVGVSKNTVSLALRNDPQIPPARREEIWQTAQRLGYSKNAVVGHLMAQLRTDNGIKPRSTLALINANADPEAFTRHPTVPTYVAGCRRQAAAHGYTLNDFWLHDPAVSGERLSKIFRTRNVRGAILVGLMKTNRLPERMAAIWSEFPCVVTGVRTREPALSFACADHHMLTLRACEHALRLGYRRPALVLDGVIDELVERRFTAGMAIAQNTLPASRRLNPFYQVEDARKDSTLIATWFRREKPDVILSLYHVVRDWLREMNLSSPSNVGLIQLERRNDNPDWAGMNQHNDIVGEAAVEMVIGMIHKGECGVPVYPRATLIGSTWTDGATVQVAPSSELSAVSKP